MHTNLTPLFKYEYWQMYLKVFTYDEVYNNSNLGWAFNALVCIKDPPLRNGGSIRD